jgi:hypothetical protein
MEDIPHFLAALVWNFWTVAIGVVLAIEPVMRTLWPGYDAWASAYLTPLHRQYLKVGAAALAFMLANYIAYHDVSTELRSAQKRLATSDPRKIEELQAQLDAVKWTPLTNDETSAFRAAVRKLPPQNITVACETFNCRDLADGFARILSEASWKVEILHRGGMDISGIMGVRLSPEEDATRSLKDTIEATTKLKVTLGDETRAVWGPSPALLVVGK